MPIFTVDHNTITILAAGGTVTLDATLTDESYTIDGSATLTSSWTLTSTGTPPVVGTRFLVFYEADINLNGNTITVFGRDMTQGEAERPGMFMITWNGSDWDVQYYASGGKADGVFNAIYRSEVTIQQAELDALFTTTKQLIAAPSAGYGIIPIRAIARLNGAGDRTTNTDIVLCTAKTSEPVFRFPKVLAHAAGTYFAHAEELSAGATNPQMDAAQPLLAFCPVGNPSGGTASPLNIKVITYFQIELLT
jgi:hypothetical protein